MDAQIEKVIAEIVQRSPVNRRLVIEEALRELAQRVLEIAAERLEGFAHQWTASLPMDEREALNCKQYAKAVRSLADGAREETK